MVGSVLELIDKDLKCVDYELIRLIDTKVPLINKVVSNIISSENKRIRPALMILSAKMCGYHGTACYPLSAVIEYIYNAAHMHDDIVDGARYRKNIPDSNGVYGNDIAVLCGDFLYSKSYINLTDHGDKQMQKVIAKAALAMSEGEVMYLLKMEDMKITVNDYIKTISSKTAALLSASCEVGGLAAKVSGAERKALADCGNYFGIACQVSDDLSKYANSQCGTNLRQGIITMPLIVLLEESTLHERGVIKDIFLSQDFTPQNLEFIVKLIIQYNVRAIVENIITENIDKAIKCLEIFNDNDYKKAMIALIRMVGRDIK